MRPGGNSVRSAASTRYALALVGSTLAFAGWNVIDANGTPSAINAAALSSAIRRGRAITALENRYQNPDSAGRASRSAARWSRFGARALTRGPSSASTAGNTTSASVAATRVTTAPASPIENRKFCGKMVNEASAAATVSELKRIVRPDVASVRRSASAPKPWTADSSR